MSSLLVSYGWTLISPINRFSSHLICVDFPDGWVKEFVLLSDYYLYL